jgi:hypothetical protein
VVDALSAFGARPEDLKRAEELRADGPYEVFPENWRALQLFLALATQWRICALSTMAGAHLVQTGLDYAAVEPAMRLLGVKRHRRAALFRQIQMMESAALDVAFQSRS